MSMSSAQSDELREAVERLEGYQNGDDEPHDICKVCDKLRGDA